MNTITVHTRAAVLLVALSSLIALAVPPARAEGGGGSTLWVATNGADYADDGYSTPANSREEPWRTITMAIRRARPGDTIVVRSGTYVEAAGWGAVPATPERPIRLQAAEGEDVLLKGHLQLVDADHWHVRGIDVTRDPDRGRDESLVKFAGGTGWSFTEGEVSGSIGVSNLMVTEYAGDPAEDFRIADSCVHTNLAGDDPPVNHHNLYLYPGLDSTGGVVERNVLYGAPNGANVKAGGPGGSDDGRGAGDLAIRFNTMADAVAGVIVHRQSTEVVIERNLVVQRVDRLSSYDAAIVGNSVSGAGNRAADNAFADHGDGVSSTHDSTRPIDETGSRRVSPDFSSGSGCNAYLPTDAVAKQYGAAASDAPLPPGARVDRVSGSSRVATAIEVSKRTSEGAEAVVIARSDAYADALAGGPLAASLDAPLLLTSKGGLSGDTAREITRLGARRAILLGGEAALSRTVADEARALGLEVERIGGESRWHTAALVAERVGGSSAFLVEGANANPDRGWPDAVAASGAASALSVPILLTGRDALPARTAAALRGRDVVVVGGLAAVSQDVAEQAGATTRLSGADRYATSTAVLDHLEEAAGATDGLWVATGTSFPDALAAGPAAARSGAGLLLVHGATSAGGGASLTAIERRAEGVEQVVVVGGPGAVTDEVVEAIRQRVGG